MTEQEKIIQEQAMEIERQRTTIQSLKVYIELLENMLQGEKEARDTRDFDA